jgi:hypothetical protein
MRTILERLDGINGYSMFGKENIVAIDTVLASDASAVGHALVEVKCGGRKKHESHEGPCSSFLSKKLFSLVERKESSVARELSALVEAYTGPLGQKFEGRSILHLTDATGVESIMKVGSKIPALHTAAVEVLEACRARNIHLKVEWRSRDDARLVEADEASRRFDADDWSSSAAAFAKIVDWAGTSPDFDLFANENNRKCQNYASRFAWSAQSRLRINAFSLDWGSLGVVWACPPPNLIIPTLKQWHEQKALGLLMVPLWKGSRFWPLLTPDGKHLCGMVERFMIFVPKIQRGPDVLSLTFSRKMPFLVMKLKGGKENDWKPLRNRSNCIAHGCKLCY